MGCGPPANNLHYHLQPLNDSARRLALLPTPYLCQPYTADEAENQIKFINGGIDPLERGVVKILQGQSYNRFSLTPM